jgi:ABC-type Fe3+ transport system permease subunit
MENLGILKWRTWSAARKGMVIGAVAAALVTICLQSVLMMTQHANDPMGRSIGYLVVGLAIPTNIPTGVLFELLHNSFGWKYTDYRTVGIICIMVVVNSFVYGMLGGVIGYGGHQLNKLARKLRGKDNT